MNIFVAKKKCAKHENRLFVNWINVWSTVWPNLGISYHCVMAASSPASLLWVVTDTYYYHYTTTSWRIVFATQPKSGCPTFTKMSKTWNSERCGNLKDYKVCLAKKDTTFWNGPFTTISDHFIANYINIFNKTEVPTVILR